MARKLPALFSRQYAVWAVVAATIVFLVGLTAAGARAVEYRWKDVILPGVSAGGIPLGEKTSEAAALALADAFDQKTAPGFRFITPKSETTVPAELVAVNDPDQTRAIVRLDADATVRDAMAVGHDGAFPLRALGALRAIIGGRDVPLAVHVARQDLISALASTFHDEETPVGEPGLRAVNDAGQMRFLLVGSHAGMTYDYNGAVNALETQLARGTIAPVTLALRESLPGATDARVAALIPEAEQLVNREALSVRDPEGGSWDVTSAQLASWITVETADGGARLALSQEKMKDFFDEIAKKIEEPAVEARFRVDNGRVSEFMPSQDGVTVDRIATAANIWDALAKHATDAALVRTVQKPKISTEDANGLGIREKLGTGMSNYAGSPGNRFKNIRNAVRKLNGILIPPGETFSLLNALQPFTLAGGWLPELVIKGDKIVPEIGGGACQIGTTTFRAAMNSGLPIVERQNHSLVVRYYNDPSNNNPGTDATIYDPSPDFKFLNDTGHAILFEAVDDPDNKKLYFTFWGTSDGRKGSYSPPKVIRWIAAPPEKITETTDLAPGVKTCQDAHPGAEASFTYTVVLPDGTTKDQVFTSRYRALAKTCLLGVAPGTLPADGTAPAAPPLDPAAAADAAAPAQ